MFANQRRDDLMVKLAIFSSLLVLMYWITLVDQNVSTLLSQSNQPPSIPPETFEERQRVNWNLMELSQTVSQISKQLASQHKEIKDMLKQPSTQSQEPEQNSSSAPAVKTLTTNNARSFKLGADTHFSKWRADTLLTKEPGTIRWIDQTVKENSVLWDIGANIGIYSMYALASVPTLKVVAFEPEALNYAEYYSNLYLNRFWDRAVVFPVALGRSNSPSLIDLNINSFQAGNGFHSVVGKTKQKETVMLWSLDGLHSTFNLPGPTHLKIDVENGEYEVLNGARDVLRIPTLKHLLVEVKGKEAQTRVKTLLQDYQFVLKSTDIEENLFFERQ